MATPRQESEKSNEDVGIEKLVAISGASLSELGTSKRYHGFAGEIILSGAHKRKERATPIV